MCLKGAWRWSPSSSNRNIGPSPLSVNGACNNLKIYTLWNRWNTISHCPHLRKISIKANLHQCLQISQRYTRNMLQLPSSVLRYRAAWTEDAIGHLHSTLCSVVSSSSKGPPPKACWKLQTRGFFQPRWSGQHLCSQFLFTDTPSWGQRLEENAAYLL